MELSLFEIAIGVGKLTESMLDILLPKSVVGCTIDPGHFTLPFP